MSTSEPLVNLDVAREHGLLDEEFEKILKILNRNPTYTEIGVFSVMWSEHCSYKNSIHVLKTLPREGENLLAKAGDENAGLVDIGNGLAVAFKIESHNHPSAVEPYQGAATGVGGIHRDIFTMGARPIASLNSLRFGNIQDSKVQYLFDGVVRGIGDYGNSFGVPTVAGEVYFENCYAGNPLVNAMSVGIVEEGNFVSAIAQGIENPVLIVGSSTGRDGIHGATFASEELTEESEQKRPSVQVGDPFAEKLLLEATLEAIKTGLIVGLQDMGAAGITSSTSEMSARGIERNGQGGIEINLDLVPTREDAMSAYEIMLSESQERMLVVVKKGYEQEIIDIYKKWNLNAVVIGKVTNDNLLRVWHNGQKVVEIPAIELVLGGGAPVYQRETREQKPNTKYPSLKPDSSINFKEETFNLISHPNIASKHWVFEQYDSMVRTNTAQPVGATDAAVIRLKNTNTALAMKTDCNSRYVYLNPKKGGMIAVAECARNLVCTGAKPLAVTNCLNFGNPYKPEIYYQFKESVAGMGDACRTFDTPVTGGNVSFYNESDVNGNKVAVYPTPVIGMIGLIDDNDHILSANFQHENDLVVLLGSAHADDLNGSEFLKVHYGELGVDAPEFDLAFEKKLQALMLQLTSNKLLSSAHDVSDGGLITCLIESAILSHETALGAKIHFQFVPNDDPAKIQKLLFSEAQGRIVVSLNQKHLNALNAAAQELEIPLTVLGHVSNDEKLSLQYNEEVLFDLNLKEVSDRYYSALENFLAK
ncbi:phosphoribosylformylglycinamidine synthase II [Chloroherpeton thalassium ATCC 35110]|uniref:Phosphoribosylformylglycinamidine synthase subunit PurL n=1 Tax=Chloroherpeton thalassium (strain ATCC 35110 / GB-78) TaxID=517418 RepID=B3QXS4_CHLT3|nr:phosphoribosylformylglycinamidine synthase subunit PurL [Chloroherpeton thalassium]ACF14989.1 phosphoribosylformylglycinamidine synthase II [Chloroherpeton thalassium ATCC 35110]